MAVGLHALATGGLLFRIGSSDPSGWHVPLTLASTYVGYEVADALSYVAHVSFDAFVANPDFRLHHLRPRLLARRSFLGAAGTTAPGSIAVLGLTLLAGHLAPPELKPVVDGLGLGLAQGLFLAQASHKHSHLFPEENPRLVRWAQRAGLMVTPEVHAQGHHRPPFDRAYAVVTGHSNRVLDALQVPSRMRRGYWRLTGKVPYTWREPGGEAIMKRDLPAGPYPTLTPITPEEAGLTSAEAAADEP